ncbi:MAG: phage tail protein [Myxococcales bacterium]|nr:phage tail protein [Myxococcales bacterium]MCB9735232.1 phage tail protein [Deltaproteobacteria bacterium]
MGFWGRGHDHIGNFNFKIEIEGVLRAAFRNCEGIGSETEIIEFGGSVDQVVRKRPGRHKYLDITLKRGWSTNDDLWDWRMAIVRGEVDRRSGSIIICADDGEEICRYNFFEAWPAKYGGFSQDGKGNDVIIEEMTLSVERLERG